MTVLTDQYIEAIKEAIFNDIDLGIVAVDATGGIVFCNHALGEMLDLDIANLCDRPCCEVFCEPLGITPCYFRQGIRHARIVVNDLIHVQTGSGDVLPVSISTTCLRKDAGQEHGVVMTVRDATIAQEMYDSPLQFWIMAQNMYDLGILDKYKRERVAQNSFYGIISKNEVMRDLWALLPRVAESDSTILINGESGTGKELLAQTIHALSPRKTGPLVCLNSGALPETLLESELFGYVAGAFTDARRDKPGRIAMAEGGTLFLDEIGDISPAMQVRLLRFLQERTYEPLGTNESRHADVRIIAATNRDLSALVAGGQFRQDLYYRINVFPLQLPPLRQRKEDIGLLCDHFINQENCRRQVSISGMTPEALAVLVNHDFPGNVRELHNCIEHAFVLCRTDRIRLEHLPIYLLDRQVPRHREMTSTLDNIECITILETLRRHNGNRTAAARELGIHKTTLWRKMKMLNIQDR